MTRYFTLLISLLISACTTAPKPAEVAKIKFVSMQIGTIKVGEEMGDYYYNEFNVPGYKVRFESNREIITRYGKNSFLHLDYFECNSSKRYPEGHAYSARDYFPFTRSQSDVVERKSNGAIIYEAQISEDNLKRNKHPVCAQIWVYDGNTRRKIWQPNFISNKIELQFPDENIDHHQ